MAHSRGCFYCDMSAPLNSWSAASSKWYGAAPNTIRQQREEIEEYITSLQQHIDSLDQAIETLKQKRSVIQLEQHRHRNLLSPILTLPGLPPEVLTFVFTLCINEWVLQYTSTYFDDRPEEPPPDKLEDRWRVSPRYAITRVCRYWRTLTLATPKLWCDIEITEYLGSFPNGNPRLAHELTLSKGLPLHMWSFGDHYDWALMDYESDWPCAGVIRQLVHTKPRWASITGPDLEDFFPLSRGLDPTSRHRYPLLRSLSGTIDSSIVPCHFYPADAPSLVNLDISIRKQAPDSQPVMPWSQLQNFRIRSPPLAFISAIFPQLTSVTRLYLQLYHRKSPTDPPTVPIFLPCVDTLELDMATQEHHSERVSLVEVEFISLLRLPALKTLSCRTPPPYVLNLIIRMLTATTFLPSLQQGVQTLELLGLDTESDFSSAHFMDLFQQLPNLKTFIMKERIQNISFNLPLMALSMKEGDMLCPALDHLSLSDGTVDLDILEGFISNRLEQERVSGKKGLQHLVLSRFSQFSSPPSQKHFEDLFKALQSFVDRPGASLYADIILTPRPKALQDQRIQCSGRSKSLTVISID